jgi:hypothetical protein
MMPVTDVSPASTGRWLGHRRVLDPAERIAEVLFGLIMVLTFTGSLSVAEAGRDDVRAMLIGALGCNIAWGVIDGVLYMMGCLAEAGRTAASYDAVMHARDPEHAHRAIANLLPSLLAGTLDRDDLERVRRRVVQSAQPATATLSRSDWWGAAAVFLLVFLSTLPVAVPFMFIEESMLALRVSNGVAITMLFIAGVAYGRIVRRTPWIIGISMVALGSALVALTIALGG